MKDKKKEKHQQEETQPKPQELETPTHEHAESKKQEQELDQFRQQLSELQKLRDDLQKEKDELFGRLQRLSADYANFQKRVPKQIEDSVTYQKESIVKSLLPVLDNFERTMQNAQCSQNVEAIVNGVQIIYDQMLDILKLHGVEQVKALGEKFNPVLHEAMLSKDEPDKDVDIVLEELQKGYRLNGRVIRPSKVVVNKRPQQQALAQPQDQAAVKPTEQIQDTGDFETTDTQ